MDDIDEIKVTLKQRQLEDTRDIGCEVRPSTHGLRREEPTHMAPEETPARRVNVSQAVRVPVMVPMMADPPERAVLSGKNAKQSEYELKQSARLEGSVSEQTMIANRDTEHLGRERGKEDEQGRFADASNEN
jgi:hypothetical protein